MEARGFSLRIDRRRFLKKAGYGSLAMASLPTLSQVTATPAWADEEGSQFTFACQSRTTIDGETHQVGLSGNGRVGSSAVEGGGGFNHTRFVGGVATLAAAGRWKATRFVSFNTIGTYGVFMAGILTMDVELIREIPSELRLAATMEVVCNISAAHLNTGKEEGFILTLSSGVSFEPFGVGITLFIKGHDEGD